MVINRHGYYWLDTWIMANVVQLATQEFCRKFLNLHNDPCGRQYDQMTQAARSVTANIAEGTSRHATSRETEMKLTDVARASLAELTNDYVNWLLQQDQTPWSVHDPEYLKLSHIPFDPPQYKDDVLYESSRHILAQKHKFDEWLNTNDSVLASRAILTLCERLTVRLRKQIESQLAAFTQEGGFTEALTTERLKQRTQDAASDNAPLCPKCGMPMIKRVAKKGTNSGKPFWSCQDYPSCHGTRKCE